MDHPSRQSPDAELSLLGNVTARMRSGEDLPARQVEVTLERGFAALMGLEADLQRLRSGSDPPAEAIAALQEAIATLREALTVLRTLSSPPGPPRVGYGFVLPRGLD